MPLHDTCLISGIKQGKLGSLAAAAVCQELFGLLWHSGGVQLTVLWKQTLYWCIDGLHSGPSVATHCEESCGQD